MKTLQTLAIALGVVFLSGCLATTATIYSSFDPSEVAWFKRSGDGTLVGSGFLRQQGGGVVSCAGYGVTLIPVSKYGTERMLALYGSQYRGFTNKAVKFTNGTDPEYQQTVKSRPCDVSGRFQFNDLPYGDYFVTTAVLWKVDGYSQGGSLMQRVSIEDDSPVEIVLSQ